MHPLSFSQLLTIIELYSNSIINNKESTEEKPRSRLFSYKFIMMTKLFILAVAIIGLATRPSSAIPAKQAIDEAFNATAAGAISLKFTLWRAANCPMEAMITAGCTTAGTGTPPPPAMCYICVCNATLPTGAATASPVPANCHAISPPTPAGGSAELSWTTAANRMTQWPGIATANSSQLYAVDDGFCYASAIDATTGRTMACFSRRILT